MGEHGSPPWLGCFLAGPQPKASSMEYKWYCLVLAPAPAPAPAGGGWRRLRLPTLVHCTGHALYRAVLVRGREVDQYLRPLVLVVLGADSSCFLLFPPQDVDVNMTMDITMTMTMTMTIMHSKEGNKQTSFLGTCLLGEEKADRSTQTNTKTKLSFCKSKTF